LPTDGRTPIGRQLFRAVLIVVSALALPSVAFPSLDTIPRSFNARPQADIGRQSQIFLEKD